MDTVYRIVDQAKAEFKRELENFVEVSPEGLTEDIYIRYLSFQYHLTMGVQKHFLAIAAHPQLSGRRKLRDFLYRFGLEEEPHFKVARHDLENLGVTPMACPLDVKLWWSFFNQVIHDRPFVRLGATCVLENLGSGAGALGHALLDNAPFLNESNTRFLQIHFHEELPHGDQIFAALNSVAMSESEVSDLEEGARIGSVIYLRLVRWALGCETLTREFAV